MSALQKCSFSLIDLPDQLLAASRAGGGKLEVAMSVEGPGVAAEAGRKLQLHY